MLEVAATSFPKRKLETGKASFSIKAFTEDLVVGPLKGYCIVGKLMDKTGMQKLLNNTAKCESDILRYTLSFFVVDKTKREN